MGKGRYRYLGQSLLVPQGGRRLPSRGGPHSLARVDQRFRRRGPRRSGEVSQMTVTVTPFKDSGLGADISGVDLGNPLAPADRDAIRRAWLDRLVLRFRDQKMTDEQQMA